MKKNLKKSKYQAGGLIDLDSLMPRANTSVVSRPIQKLSDKLLPIHQQNYKKILSPSPYPTNIDIDIAKAKAMMQIAEGQSERIKDYYRIVSGANPEKLSKRRKATYRDRFHEKQTGGDLISQLGYRNDSPFKNAPQLNINSPNISMENVSTPIYGTSNQTGETKLMKPNKKYNFKNTTSVTERPAYAEGGIMNGILGAVQGASSFLGPIGMGVSAAASLAPLVSKLFAKPDNTILSGSPGQYQAGGDIPLSGGAFQVKGNPSQVDGNSYPSLNANLDHNEVITTTAQGQKFVFSTDLKDPITGKAFSELAAPQERAKGKAEKILKSNPYDEQAKSTVSMSNSNLNHISNMQEIIASALGLRNQDGSTKQEYQNGGQMNKYQSAGTIAPPKDSDFKWDPILQKYIDKAAVVAAPTPYNPKYNPFVDPQITALSASPRNPPVTTTLPTTTAPRNIGLGKITKSDKTATSGKYDWLEAGQNFNINNPDPYAEQAAATEAAGGLRNTPFDLSMDQRVAIVDPNFTARQTFYNEETDTPAQSGLNADRTPATLPIKEAKYQTPWTLGDTFKGIELLGKGIGAFGKAEVEKPLLDNTQITQEVYDPTANLQQTQRSYSNYVNSIGATTPINLRRSLTNSALASKYAQDNQTLSGYNAMNQGAKTQYQQRLGQQRQFNVQSQFNTNNINAANRAAQDSVQQNWFTSMGQFGEDLNRKRYAADIINLYRNQAPDVFDSYIKTLGR